MVSFIPGFSLISEEEKFRCSFVFCISADIGHFLGPVLWDYFPLLLKKKLYVLSMQNSL